MTPSLRPTRIALALAALGFGASALAAPTGGSVVAGEAAIRTQGNQTDVVQTTPRAVIDWRSFNIGAGESVVFRQPDAASSTLNRVTGGQASQIAGSLSANGQVILLNPNGVLFGRDARVDAASLVVTTAKLDNGDYMAGRLRFTDGEVPGASIVNRGTITVRDGGLAAFVAPHVRNEGMIHAKLGRVVLASGSRFTLDLAGDGLLELGLRESDLTNLRDVDGKPVGALVENAGTLAAPSGRVLVMTPEIARNLVDNAINLGGVVRADAIERGPAGEILLVAKNGNVNLAGDIGARGTDTSNVGTLRVVEDREITSIGAAKAGALGDVLRTGTNVVVESTGRIEVMDARIDGRGGAVGAGLTLRGGAVRIGNDLLTAGGALTIQGATGSVEVWRGATELVPGRTWPMLFAENAPITVRAATDVNLAHLVTRGDVTVESAGGNVRLVASLGADLDGSYALKSLTVNALGTPDSRDVGNVSEMYDVKVAAGGRINVHATRNIQLFAPVNGRAGLTAARAGTDGRELHLDSDRLGTGNLAFNAFYWSTNPSNSRARHIGAGTNPARADGRWADLTRTTKEAGSPTVGAPPGPTQAIASAPVATLAAGGVIAAPAPLVAPPPLADIVPGASNVAHDAPATTRLALASVARSDGDSTPSDEEGYSATRGVAQAADVGRSPAVAPARDVFAATEHVVETRPCDAPQGAATTTAIADNPYFRMGSFGQPLAIGCR